MLKQFLLPSALSLALAVGLGVGAAAAEPAMPVLAPIVAQLEAEGYDVIDTHLSWLGRLVVVSIRDGMLRELVLNRTTGAVLSDRLFEQAQTGAAGSASQPATGSPQRNGSDKGSGSNGAGGNGAH